MPSIRLDQSANTAQIYIKRNLKFRPSHEGPSRYYIAAGWSSPVAREAHNLEVVGSNPAPATQIEKAAEIRLPFFVDSGLSRTKKDDPKAVFS